MGLRDGHYAGVAQYHLRTVFCLGRYFFWCGNDDHFIDPTEDRIWSRRLQANQARTQRRAMEFFTAWYSGNIFERDTFLDRVVGQYGPFTWVMLACNVFIPLLLFSRRIRTHLGALFSIAVAALIGMWLERYVIVVSSLSRGFDPAAWGELYQPTWVEASMTAASFAGFFLLFLVFIKVFPCISISELKEGATEHTEPDDMTGVPERV